MKLFILFVIFLLPSAGLGGQKYGPLRFAIPTFKPYTYTSGSVPKGIGVTAVSEVLDGLGLVYKISVVPNYARALAEVKAGRSDGFFLASRNDKRDEYAVFSTPVMTNNWEWILRVEDADVDPRGGDFKKNEKVGTVSHTNTHKWLLKNGYLVDGFKDISSAIRLMEIGRLKALFLAGAVFDEARQGLGKSIGQFSRKVEIAKPFGIYISKSYLKANNGFMKTLNKKIK